jgi:TolB-like protein
MNNTGSEEKPAAEKAAERTSKWQIITVVLVLSVFVVGGIIFTEWRNLIFSGNAAPKAIAVLPFENVNLDGYAGSIADNLSESLLNEIAQNPDLPVVPRSEVFRYKGKREDPGRAGKALNAKWVVTGKVMREGESLTIKIELAEVEKNSRIWSKQYNIPIAEVMTLPPEISREIIAAAGSGGGNGGGAGK